MDDFFETVIFTVIGGIAIIFGLAVLLIVQPWFWLAIIALTYINNN